MRSRGTGPSSFVNKGPSNRVATLTTRGRSQRRGARGSFSCRRVRHAHLAARRRATMGVPKQRRERSTTSRGTGYSLDSSPDYRAVLRRPHDETIAFEGLIAPCYAARREVCRHPRSPGPVEQSRWHSAVRCERHRGQEAMLRPTRLGLAMRLDYVRQFCTQYLVIGYSEGFKAKCNEWRLLSDVQRRSSQRKQEYLKRACQNGCVRPRLAQLPLNEDGNKRRVARKIGLHKRSLAAVIEGAGLDESGVDEFLRRRGLHQSQLAHWQQAALEARGSPSKSSRPSADLRAPDGRPVKLAPLAATAPPVRTSTKRARHVQGRGPEGFASYLLTLCSGERWLSSTSRPGMWLRRLPTDSTYRQL